MMKKSFLLSLFVPVVLVSLLVIAPDHAQAGWFGEKSLAATFGSFFSKFKSFFTRTGTLPEKPSGPIQANCTPPVPTKPAGIDLISPYGVLNVTPEISTAGPDNIVTISLNSNLDDVNFVRIYVPFPADLNEDIIDWYPKEVGRTNYLTGDGAFTWSPSSPNYWIKVRMRDATIQQRAKNTTNTDGWRKIWHSFLKTLYRRSQRLF
ncbi:MAG: hypothetical protein HYW91_00385 [Candidatus Sungbacteria bacterium]|nr:hypothetical protein [Candidatus Sungbacteria bacterium]